MRRVDVRRSRAGRLAAPAIAALVAAVTGLAPAAPATAAVEEVAVISTPHGEIVWRFFPGEAPGHTSYMKELIRRGFYEETTFHRVIPHFVIQGGDPNSKDADRTNDGEGEADRRLNAEFSRTLHYRPGTVGMARDADPDSGSCQFFIALESIPRLDGRYTIFGEVIEGLAVARRIAVLPRDLNDNPLERVTISARIEEREVPDRALSLEAGESGETITGPGGRPLWYDPGNVLWSKPALEGGAGGSGPEGRVEVTVDTSGRVIDVRFPDLDTPCAAELIGRAMGWRFQPVLYDGEPRKVRFEIGSDGSGAGPTSWGYAPVEPGGEVTIPRPAVRVDLPKGAKAPAKRALLRLTVGPGGEVTDAALQESCGDPALDAAAVVAAKRLVFTPAERRRGPGREPEPVAAYLDVEARFVEPGG